MEQLGALFLRVCTVSAGCSVVLALLLALLPKLREKIAARSLYVLFLVLALRLLLPVEVRLPAPAVTVPAPDYTLSVPVPRPAPAEPDVGQVQPVLDPVESPRPAPVRSIPVLHILALAWALGAAGCALCSAGGFLLARRRLLKGSVPADIDLEPLRRELGVRRPVGPVRPVRPVRLVYSAAAPCPLALGLLRPVIVLPAGQPQVDELVLRHELTHIRRWDVAYKLVLSLACWVNWFNPLVWLMDKAAGRNLELCCDDEVTRDLSDGERRRYGNLLLDASAARAIPFSTCFSGGKNQMKERLLNLFAHKRNSAALVGLVLIAALLAGGLVACEKADASAPTGSPDRPPFFQEEHTVTPENQARRDLFQVYLVQENYKNTSTSAVLADLTGDGLEEMLVLTVSTRDGAIAELDSVTAENFGFGQWQVFGVHDGAVIEYPALSAISSSHAGWGYQYLIPLTDAEGWAILDFRPYTGQGMADYSYSLLALDEEAGAWQSLASEDVHFSLDPANSMGGDTGDAATPEKVQAFLDRVQVYRDCGAPLLLYNEAYDGATGGPEFDFQWFVPSAAFSGMGGIYKTENNVAPNSPVEFPLPSAASASPENEARRALLKDYFYQNFTGDNASVVLADLTGDGLEEMLVLTMHTTSDTQANLRQSVSAEEFAYSEPAVFGVRDGAVVPAPDEMFSVGSSHAGWGYVYLVPRSDGNGFALLNFRPYSGQGQASYTYDVYGLDEQSEEWLSLDRSEVFFHIAPDVVDSSFFIMGEDAWIDSSVEEVEQLLSRVQAYRDSGVPLLAYQDCYLGITGEREFAYLNTAPADVFSGAITMDISSLRGHVVTEGGPISFDLPNPPATAEEALDRLEASVAAYPGTYLFRIPNYDGEWNIYIAGRMRMGDEGDNYMSVHYLEGETWTPGKRYSFEVAEGAYFSELTLDATVTGPDGTQAERTIALAGPQNEVDSDLPDGE